MTDRPADPADRRRSWETERLRPALRRAPDNREAGAALARMRSEVDGRLLEKNLQPSPQTVGGMQR